MKRAGLRGSFWPSPTEEQVLRASLLRGEAAVTSWRSVEATIDIDRATDVLYRLLPLLGSNLRAHEIDTPILPRLRGLQRKTWVLNNILMGRTAGIVRLLDEAGIPSMILKGCAIGLGYYGDVGLRPMGDIDLMVKPADIGRAVERLTSAGWTDATERKPGGTVFRHTHAYYLSAGPEIGCDLHWTIGQHLLVGPGEDPTRWFWPEAVEFDGVGGPAKALNPTDQLLHVILHGAQPGSGSRLQWIADAVTILRTAEIDWERLEDLAIRTRATIRVSDALSYVRDPYVPEAVPAGLVARLRAYPLSPLERLEYAMASWDVGSSAGMFPATVATFVRETRGWPIGRRIRLFPTFLQETWELDSLGDVPGTAFRKAARTLGSWRPKAFR